MKINWGGGITITIIVFTLISFWVIYFSFNQEVNLVRDDYYEEEIRHQDKMDKIKRTQNLEVQLNIGLKGDDIILSFPSVAKDKNVGGTILLYRPSDRNLDTSIPISVDSTLTQVINKDSILPGLWKVQVSWQVDSISYFNEKILMVN